ncbi:nucleoplasmin-like isoform X2 [Hirundo rustica]|uniref:nucleoplasmin-like isoform X2 n=1 Tax=Hirundo rustica TaxID=43150 RepID=UPI001A94D858|nr:nucleoplasmin-like isoform X2 [Hirundo rustica]
MNSSFYLSRSLSEERPVAVLWGCQLGTGARSCVVKEDDDLLEHLVLLRTICLGADARDELHVVAVDSKNASGERKPVPIAALRSSLLPMWKMMPCLKPTRKSSRRKMRPMRMMMELHRTRQLGEGFGSGLELVWCWEHAVLGAAGAPC